MQQMDKKIYLLSAIYLVVQPEDFEKIRQDWKMDEVLIEEKDQFIDTYLQDKNHLSEKQKKALCAYLYLYCKLVQNPSCYEGLNGLFSLFDVEGVFIDSCDQIYTPERLEYLTKDFELHERPYATIFMEPNEFIREMINQVVGLQKTGHKFILEDLQASEYEEPTDRSTLEALKLNKGIEKLLKLYFEYDIERTIKVHYTGSNILVTQQNIPYLYQAFQQACRILDVKEVPKLYVTPGFINAQTIGSSTPIVTITSGCLSLLSYDELLFVLGHEIGHIKSQHVLYHTLGRFIPYIGEIIGNFTLGIGELALQGMMLLLYNWFRKSQLTADRAGLLACQNKNAAISVLAKVSGYPPQYYDTLDEKVFLQQAQEFEDLDQDHFNKFMKFLITLRQNDPYAVLRGRALDDWVKSGEYERLLNAKKGSLDTAQSFKENICLCLECGTKISRKDKFCKRCGSFNTMFK